MTLGPDGWMIASAGEVARVPSPNCDERPDGVATTLLVIHCISLPPGRFDGDAIEALFTNTLDHAAHPYFDALRGLRVSAHFLVRRDGTLVQFVGCRQRAWHAGVSSFEGRSGCNDFSIGIELEGEDDGPYEPAQYVRLVAVTNALLARYPIDAVAAHSDIAPLRKTDPGPGFDWNFFLSNLDRVLRKPT